jgi:hypothetical protein
MTPIDRPFEMAQRAEMAEPQERLVCQLNSGCNFCATHAAQRCRTGARFIIIEVLELSVPDDAVPFVVPLDFDFAGVDFDLGVSFVSLSSLLIVAVEASFFCFL